MKIFGKEPGGDVTMLRHFEDLAAGSSDFRAAMVAEPKLFLSWEIVESLPQTIRYNEHYLKSIDLHISETGKTASQIKAEIAASGSYHKWMSDHFVTFIKDGYRLDKASIDVSYATHVNIVESVTTNNVIGGHNRVAFMDVVYDGLPNTTKRVAIVESETPNGVLGFTELKYKTYAVNGNGPNVNQLTLNQAGEPILNSGSPKIQTLYDPAIVSEAYYKEMGYRGFMKAMEDGSFEDQRRFFGIIDGIKVYGHYEEPSKTIRTWWLQMP